MNNDGTWDAETNDDTAVQWQYSPPANGVSETHTITLKYQFNSSLTGQTAPWFLTVSEPITIYPNARAFADSHNNSFVQVQAEDCSNKAPVLILEGFDPTNASYPADIFSRAQALIQILQNEGYEVFIMNWADGGASVENNAAVLEHALAALHALCPAHEIGLVGVSMGGVIARYALADEERQGLDHHVSLFVSYDSPQQGAHLNRGLLDWLHSHTSISAINALARIFQSEAAMELLDYNPWDSLDWHNSLYNKLATLNGDGYPHQSYNVAISDGAVDATGSYTATYGYELANTTLVTIKVWTDPFTWLSYDLPAQQADVGPGCTTPDLPKAGGGSAPVLPVYWGFQLARDPVFIPTQSALDLQGPQFDAHGDITNHPTSRFMEVQAQTSPQPHTTMTIELGAQLLSWIHRWVCPASQAPDVVSLATPADGADVSCIGGVHLAWVPACNAQTFELQVASDVQFAQLTYSTSLSSPAADVGALIPKGTYYWRVRGVNAAGAGPWTPTRSFVWGPVVSVAGATLVDSWAPGRSWTASVTYSTPPYTYGWATYGLQSWYPAGTGPTCSGQSVDSHILPFLLRCDVGDACGNYTVKTLCISSNTEPAVPTVTINGPTTLGYQQVGTWDASATGGQVCGQYGYAWRWRPSSTTTWSNVISTAASCSLPMISSAMNVRVDVSGVQTAIASTLVAWPSGGGCPTVDVLTATGWNEDNTILGRSLQAQAIFDSYRLRWTPLVSDSLIHVRIRENEEEVTSLDQVRLIAIDHRPEVAAYASGGRVVLGTSVPAQRVTAQYGGDITAAVTSSGLGYWAAAGETLTVEMGAPSQLSRASKFSVESSGPFVIDDGGGKGGGTPAAAARRMSSDEIDADVLSSTGILVQAPDEAGAWQTVAHYYPRENPSEALFDSVRTFDMRLVALDGHRINFVGEVQQTADTLDAKKLVLRSAQHSRLGDVYAAVVSAGNVTTTIDLGDTLDLAFASPQLQPGLVRDYFLLSRGAYTANLPAHPVPVVIPTRFALRQNQPNPFSQATNIRLELPVGAMVRLEVFDTQGRRVKSITNRYFPAGYQSVEWDHADEGGQRVGPGVYFYRMQAGSFHDQKKMVLLAN